MSVATFTPPTVEDVPSILPESSGPAFRLFRYFKSRSRYVGVFLLSDNTIVQDTAIEGLNTNTDLPYPWNPNDPNVIAMASYYNFDTMQMVLETFLHEDNRFIVKKYGDGPQYVTSAEATLLTTAGYGAYLT